MLGHELMLSLDLAPRSRSRSSDESSAEASKRQLIGGRSKEVQLRRNNGGAGEAI